MRNFIISLLVTCTCIGIFALILVFSFGSALLDAYKRGDWLWIGIFVFFVFFVWLGFKLIEKINKK